MFDPADYELTVEELPTWMRPRPHGIDWPLLATLVLCLLVAWPLAAWSGLPRSPEAALQMHRILAVARSLQAGDIYPRWAPDFVYGYGSPLFNYIAPLPYTLGGLYTTLVQAQPHTSLKLMLILSIFVGGIGMLSFLRRRWGTSAGILGAAIFLFAPYTALTGPYQLTDLGGLWAVALFPAMLWALDRAASLGRGRDLMLLVLTGGSLLVADASLAVLLFALAAGWLFWIILLAGERSHWRVAIAGLGLSLALSAFYRLPAWLEADAIRWKPLRAYPPDPIASSDLFAPSPRLDRSAFNPLPTLHLGTATWLLAALGAVCLLAALVMIFGQRLRPAHNRSTTGMPSLQALTAASYFLPVAGLMAVALFSPESSIWAARNHFGALQPVDLLGPLTVCCAILGAQALVMVEHLLSRRLTRALGMGIPALALATSAANVLYTPGFLPVETPVTEIDQLEIELRGHALGTFRTGHLLPLDVAELPPPSTALLDSYDLERINKIELRGLTDYKSFSISSHGPTHDHLLIESRRAQTLTVMTFNYPGWQAKRNGREAPIESTPPTGLMSIPLEAGPNEIELRFRNTALRNFSWLLSAAALASTLVAGYWLDRRRDDRYRFLVVNTWLQHFKREQKLMVAGVVLLLAVVSAAVRYDPSLVTDESPSSSVPTGAETLQLIVDGGIGFLGYQIEPHVAQPGDTLNLTTYWRANRPNLNDHQIGILLVDAVTGAVVYETHYRHLANWPSKRWPTQGYVVAAYQIPLSENLPAGDYQAVLQVEACERADLVPCENAAARDIFNLQGFLGKQIVLPTRIAVEQP